MKPQIESQAFSSASKLDSYAEVISAIQKDRASSISVPDLSDLLGVKPTTLNARFRRHRIAIRTVGRTNFVPLELALDLAELHKYSLIGWPTLQQASQLTGVKPATIKAKCEKRQLEGHIDLTKRLRVNPAELEHLRPRRALEHDKYADVQTQGLIANDLRRDKKGNRALHPTRVQRKVAFHPSERASLTATNRCAERISSPPPRFVLPPAPEPKINVITGKDYGLLEFEARLEARADSGEVRRCKQGQPACLSYDPERPFSVSECAVGKRIKYGEYGGSILKIIDDPFSPKILARFPEHEHPLMREVLLVVGRKSV